MTFLDILIHAALIVWTLIGLVAVIGGMVLWPQVLRTLREVDDIADFVKNRAGPTMEQAQQVLDQFQRISTIISDDIEIVDHTVIRAAESVERMIELTEDRVAEVNALLSVAIEEAEDTFISGAGVLRAIIPGRKPKRSWLPRGKRRRFG